MPLKIIFMGTPHFAIPIIKSICKSDHDILCVYTQPPKKKDRGQKKNITPIICFGESHEIQEKGETEKFLNSQLSSIVNDENLNIDSCILAYEPLWAIGKGVPADLETINNSISYITKIIDLNKSNLKILYGGSVDSENSGEILSVDNVSGLLVGNSSLDGKEFANIAKKF